MAFIAMLDPIVPRPMNPIFKSTSHCFDSVWGATPKKTDSAVTIPPNLSCQILESEFLVRRRKRGFYVRLVGHRIDVEGAEQFKLFSHLSDRR